MKTKAHVAGVHHHSGRSKLRANDLARTIMADGRLGDTLWLVEFVGERGHCAIREAGNPLAGCREFDTSLLQRVERA